MQEVETTSPARNDTGMDVPNWVVGLIIFGLAGIGGPLLFFLLFWMI